MRVPCLPDEDEDPEGDREACEQQPTARCRTLPPTAHADEYGRRVVSMSVATRATGRCLCGAVRFDLQGPLRDVLLCHCVECRRWSGHVFAATAVRREHLLLRQSSALRWIASPESESEARRGFCAECGSSLFWDAPARDTVSVAAGALDEPTRLRVLGHVYVGQAGDYYELPEDGLPRSEGLV